MTRTRAFYSFSQGIQTCRQAPGWGQTCSPRWVASDKPQGSVTLVKGVKEEPQRLTGVG